MFEIGDLVTVYPSIFARYVPVHTFQQWSTNPLGIVVAVEPLDDSPIILVKIHFQSLGGSYWLRSGEITFVSPPRTENE